MDRIAQELQSENMILKKRILNLELAKENAELRANIEALESGEVHPLLCCLCDRTRSVRSELTSAPSRSSRQSRNPRAEIEAHESAEVKPKPKHKEEDKHTPKKNKSRKVHEGIENRPEGATDIQGKPEPNTPVQQVSG